MRPIGLRGKQQKNAHRDIMRWQRGEAAVTLDPYIVDVDLWDPYTLSAQPSKLPIFLPHELFAATYEAGCFTEVMGANFRAFWDCVRGSTWGREHPAFENESLLSWTCPVRMHGDDAVMKSLQNQKLNIVSFHGEMCRRPALQSRLLSFAVRDKKLVQGKTLRFVCLYLGVAPTGGPD